MPQVSADCVVSNLSVVTHQIDQAYFQTSSQIAAISLLIVLCKTTQEAKQTNVLWSLHKNRQTICTFCHHFIVSVCHRLISFTAIQDYCYYVTRLALEIILLPIDQRGIFCSVSLGCRPSPIIHSMIKHAKLVLVKRSHLCSAAESAEYHDCLISCLCCWFIFSCKCIWRSIALGICCVFFPSAYPSVH